MPADRTQIAPPNTFALSEGELIALQAQAAQALGVPDIHFHDTLSDGSAAPTLAVIPAGSFEYGSAPEEAAPDEERPRKAALIERDFARVKPSVRGFDFLNDLQALFLPPDR